MTSTERDALTVGQVADRFGVTVRTLHHYDEIGLLSPSERSYSGYRLYTPADLERMQQVVVYRRLGFPLEEVAELLAGEADPVEHLRRQRDAVRSRMDELDTLVHALDEALEKEMNHQPLSHEEMRELFGDSFKDEYQQEAQERWGDSPQWKQSAARTKRYTKQDWVEIKAEADAVNAGLLEVFRTGVAPDSAGATEAAEAHRLHIDRRYYDCPPDFHTKLADLYVADPRYLASMGGSELPGYGEWIREAFVANAAQRS